jgi:hypothetical protein
MDHARRYRIAVRLILYPLAFGLILVFWQRHKSDDPPSPIEQMVWGGLTSQGKGIRALTVSGRLMRLSAHVPETCSDGRTWDFHPVVSQPGLVQRGQEVSADYSGPGNADNGFPVLYDDSIRVHLNGVLTGTIDAHVSWMTASGRLLRCESGLVTFSMRRLRT